MTDIFYVISMVGKNGNQLYLACTDNDKVMSWDNNIDNACWFPTVYEAQKFARGYFINFKKYYIIAVNCNIEEV